MNASMLLAHRQALLTAIARVHVDEDLAGEQRAVILPLLLGCMEDTEGDDTLDALDAIFEDYDNILSCAVTEAFAALTNAAHVLGHAVQRSR